MSRAETKHSVDDAVKKLISAYQNGYKIALNIRQRRTTHGSQISNTQLEKAFQKGELDIKLAAEDISEGLGIPIPEDVTAAADLKDIIIEVLDCIGQLGATQDDNTLDDFAAYISSARTTRLRALNVLNQLNLRLQGHKVEQAPSRSIESQSAVSPDESHFTNSPPSGNLNRMSLQSSPILFTDEHQHQKVESPSGSVSPQTESKRKFSLKFGFNRRHSKDEPREVQSRNRRSTNSPLSPEILPASMSLSPRPDVPQAKSPSAMSRSRASDLPIAVSASKVFPITEASNFGGFCKGAYYAQTLQLSKAMQSSMRHYERAYHCRKCNFKILADMTDPNQPHFDDRVYKLYSVSFRQLFLFKSHLVQQTHGVRSYRCIVCALKGQETGRCESEGQLFEHLLYHQGEVIETPLEGMLSFNAEGIETARKSNFDIALPQKRMSQPFFLPPSATVREGVFELDHTPALSGSAIQPPTTQATPMTQFFELDSTYNSVA